MIWDFLKVTITPITKLIDEVHISDEERAKLKNELSKIEAKVGMELLNYERQLLSTKTNIIMNESSGGSWLQKNWLPIMMLALLMLVVFDSFGWLPHPLVPEVFTLLQIGLNGHISIWAQFVMFLLDMLANTCNCN